MKSLVKIKFEVICNGKIINPNNSVKHFGMYLDKDLTGTHPKQSCQVQVTSDTKLGIFKLRSVTMSAID